MFKIFPVIETHGTPRLLPGGGGGMADVKQIAEQHDISKG
jgi:hypothetical protein